jgi:hypothetical protein
MLWIAPSEKDSATATLEKRLWDAADQFRANSKLTYSEHAMPVLGVIFLCHAANRCYAAIEADQADGKMPKRPLVRADFAKRRQHGAPPAGNVKFAWVQHIVRFGVSSSTSGARIARRLGVA